jgi:isoleucyl-tRNA synthetase
METVRTVVNLGRGLRKKNELRVRQPLNLVTVIARSPATRDAIAAHSALIAEELNVRNVEVGDDESALVELSAKADFGTLGPRLGSRTKEVAAAIASLDHESVAAVLDGEPATVLGEQITVDDIVVDRTPHQGTVVASTGPLTVAIDTEVTEELRIEGLAREIVNRLQTMRRRQGFDVTDRITVAWSADDAAIRKAFDTHGPMIAAEVLATSLDERDVDDEPTDLVGKEVYLRVDPISR